MTPKFNIGPLHHVMNNAAILFRSTKRFLEQLREVADAESELGDALTGMIEAIDEQLEELTGGLETYQELREHHADWERRLAYNYRCRLWWRLLALQAGMGRCTLEGLKNAAFREMIERVPTEETLSQQLEAIITELETPADAGDVNKPLRCVQLDPSDNFLKGT